MARPLKVAAACLLASLALLPACSDEDESAEAFPPECALPSPDPGVDASEVPEDFLIEGSVVRTISDEKDIFVVALNVPVGVEETLRAYRRQLSPPDYEVISEDNEGFEAEIFLRRAEDGNLMAVQIRQPRCRVASAVFVTVAKRQR